MKLLLSQITILERQRIDLGDIPELADSFNRLGQINPILVEKVGKDTYNLVAGCRRLAAATLLKWDHIKATTREDLTELQRQEIELEEDTKRKDRTWQERALVYLKLHRLKGYQDSEWTKKKLAELLGKSIGHVTEICNLAEVLDTTRDQITPWEQGLWACEGTYAYQKCNPIRGSQTY
jgi:ParB family chromosome partitioning protein